MEASFRVQVVVAALLLLGTWLLYASYPSAGIDPVHGDPTLGIKPEWVEKGYLTGVAPAWQKNANVGHELDLVLLNMPVHVWDGFAWVVERVLPTDSALFVLNTLPAPQRFAFNNGGYQTINFVPSLATMLFGLMCGRLLRGPRSARHKLQILLLAGVAGLVVGQVLNLTGVCPLVKRIWTPSWALFSTGWCCLILAALYGVVDVLEWRRWTWPLVVVGVNSLAIYCMGQLLKPWATHTWQVHLGSRIFLAAGPLWEPVLQALAYGLTFWLMCLWLYRNKIFVRI